MERLGIVIPVSLAFTELSIRDLQELAREAESAGFEGIFVPEFMNDALATAQAMAYATTRIKTGPWIANIYLRHPALCAQTAVTIADSSDGRLILGLGVSHGPIVEQVYKLKHEHPPSYLRNYVTTVREVIAGRAFAGAAVHPPPPAKHRVPIYVAALALKTVAMTGELADGVLLYLCPSRRIPKAIDAVAKGAAKAGRPRSAVDISTGLPICVTDDLAAARQAARTNLGFYGALPFYNKLFHDSGFEAEAAALAKGDIAGVTEQMIDELYLVGSAQRCRERVATFRAAGVEFPIIVPVAIPGQSLRDAARKAIAAFA